MRLDLLYTITIHFPETCHDLLDGLSTLLGQTVARDGTSYEIRPTTERHLPTVGLDLKSSTDYPVAEFYYSDNESLAVDIKNITGLERRHPSSYRALEIFEVVDRLSRNGISVSFVDHIGFNLPWFGKQIHPAVADLRNRLKTLCLYHLFPTGKLWDFIIPGEVAEIRKRRRIDYSQIRRPKFEIVSFEKASTPLVQIDLSVAKDYETIRSLFPEGLDDRSMRNVWIYLRNASVADVCLVINEKKTEDWSSFFEGHRLV
jgi:hypothetical protein